MKVAIYTITDGQNYGNRLQNYALQHYLKSRNIDVETLHNVRGHVNQRSVVGLTYWIIKNVILQIFGKRKDFEIELRRIIKFNRFDKKYINFSQQNLIKRTKKLKKYDFFICGSDQIWNPEFGYAESRDFLFFIDKEKRYSYSASFGIEKLNDKDFEFVSSYMQGMKKVSVREEKALEIIKKLGRDDAVVNIDPTFLVNKEEWELIEKRPKDFSYAEGEYYFIYILGNITSEGIEKVRKSVGNEKYVYLNELGGDKGVAYSPDEFLWLLHCSKAVITNSFHGMCFSIIYEKRFMSLVNYGNTAHLRTRFETISKVLGKDIINTKEFVAADTSYSKKIIKCERKKTDEYFSFLDR